MHRRGLTREGDPPRTRALEVREPLPTRGRMLIRGMETGEAGARRRRRTSMRRTMRIEIMDRHRWRMRIIMGRHPRFVWISSFVCP